ncbi:MAG: phenylalanine--tRNA ligase subunit alpha [Gammaproteobacteria bacterium RIFCSPLOWO2_02_FULL_42_14]|nr:MAG: phenylalanine--tRNA ligase subunit alpha [Gammaproteobacteria bacterium RIFCSPHIGHO2_02_FULL_42_43]OGT29172.1 MAG: phenylalanine--tRNA ligase subunit alpha [Gammaproteobacteria bacterium RIFCSPHIGHO2_01_FULL_42_8]OGT51171.1 MAG: phenylalanine--tRNA ligase subunit alpha [Gammaproteobacteria bacterium RIFCSPHIGHO2_12_FULL_41_25]OGT62933.1 MAG: phenylalanine--tRNA ligase subunit alpha [Gammaproteobacteria bacterium RIFCSPLOWO2_02_FULL_42_14]OGT86065.1 MAG: phenylalanine--tRNA ligase subuni
MQEKLSIIVKDAATLIQNCKDAVEVQALRVKYLGKKGELTELLKQLGSLDAADRPRAGQFINDAKSQIQEWLNTRENQFNQAQLNARLSSEKMDVTLPSRGQALGSQHPVSRVRDRVVTLFSTMGFTVAEGPEIEDDYHNFSALNFQEHHPAKESQDTFYFPNGLLLRTHTSPVQIRTMKKQKPPLRIITPGRVYRRDSDMTHTPMFHQLEGLVVDSHCTFANLKHVLQTFINAFFEKETPLRFRPSFFPFTEPSAEVDILSSSNTWLEVLGCGMVHPNVLDNAGIDSKKYSGFAFGIGLDRLAMLRYRIPDLRLLFENDVRFLKQF